MQIWIAEVAEGSERQSGLGGDGKKPFSGGEHKHCSLGRNRIPGEKNKLEGKAVVVPEKEGKDYKWGEVRQSKICKLLISVSVYMNPF